MDHLKSLSEDSDSKLFLTVLSMVTHHELIDKSLSNWALDLLESFLLIFTSGIWHINLRFDASYAKVVGQRLLGAVDTFIGPFSEKHWLNGEVTGGIFSCRRKKS